MNVDYVSVVNHVPTGLIIALRAIGCTGEFIITAFSFIATAHSIKWDGLEPVFVDTDDYAGNLKPKKPANCLVVGIPARIIK